MIKCLLTGLGWTGRENIWQSVMAYGLSAAKYFLVMPSHSVNKNIMSFLSSSTCFDYFFDNENDVKDIMNLGIPCNK